MLNKSAPAMNEAESNLIRSPLLCSTPQPRKLGNDLFFLHRRQELLAFFSFGWWYFVYRCSRVTAGPRIGLNSEPRTASETHKIKYGHRRTLALSEECCKLRGISWYWSMIWSVCAFVSTSVKWTWEMWKRKGGGGGLRWETDWQNSCLKQVSWFYNQLRNVDMNRLLLLNTEQRWTTSSKHLRAIKLFQLTCAFLSA